MRSATPPAANKPRPRDWSGSLTACLCWLSILIIGDVARAAPNGALPQQLQAGEKVEIVCLGDSVTGVYYHTGGLRAYPEVLETTLRKCYPQAQVSVFNAGISGHTTADGLARLERDVLSRRPRMVTVMFGLNDMLATPLPTFQANLTHISNACRTAGAEVVFCTPNDIEDDRGRTTAKLKTYADAVRATARELNIVVADVNREFQNVRQRDARQFSMLLSDAIHPNLDGHRLIAETIAKSMTDCKLSAKEPDCTSPALPLLCDTLSKTATPVKVLVMEPYSHEVGQTIRRAANHEDVVVENWSVAGRKLVEIADEARSIRERKFSLIVVAVPWDAPDLHSTRVARSFATLLNWSLSYDQRQWEVLVVSPSVERAPRTPEESRQEELIQQLARAQDLPIISRVAFDGRSREAILREWLNAALSEANPARRP